ncbi:mannitol-1-phosphate 5-dehydrogenase [Ganoderma leucocontextum]|nr:mannitol-1-phosphate 5-dehydrogenase [Ganoderma leucocontextum]
MTISHLKAIHFGAGNIGRGFIAPLLVESGYHVVFADVDKAIIHLLNTRDSYDVLVLDEDEVCHSSVSNVSGLVSTSNDVIQQFADPAVDLVTTAVGPTILERIAATIAKGLQARRRANGPPLNIIACENVINQTTLLREHVFKTLSDEDKAWVDDTIGFADCSVDRIVPPYESSGRGSPLDVGVEGFYEWVVDEGALRRTPIRLKGVKLTKDLRAYVERKLFTLNCGHAIIAYLGFLKGHNTIHTAVHDKEIHDIVHAALRDEAGAALMRRHQFDEAEYGQYVDKIMERFANPRLKDDVVRVGREPLRKLSKGDRLLGPTSMALEFGLPIDNLSMGIAAAFLYDVPEDKQSVELQNRVKREGISKVVADVTGFEEGGKEHRKITHAYQRFRFEYTLPN